MNIPEHIIFPTRSLAHISSVSADLCKLCTHDETLVDLHLFDKRYVCNNYRPQGYLSREALHVIDYADYAPKYKLIKCIFCGISIFLAIFGILMLLIFIFKQPPSIISHVSNSTINLTTVSMSPTSESTPAYHDFRNIRAWVPDY